MKLLPHDTLETFATDVLAQGGVGRDEAALVAHSLVGANLRGHDSHGVMRVPYYLAELDKGTVFSSAEFTVLRDTPSILTADGHWGIRSAPRPAHSPRG
ncbi:MAG: Ldh family oxidoreductase [Pirellulales bacterium]